MVNNPLYPGYTPRKNNEEDISPLYPGYYTGKPIQKIPESKNYIKPVEFKVDEIMEEIDTAGKAVLFSPLAAPKWIKDRIIDDWKQQLKVSIKPPGLSMTELDDYDTVEFPGASIGISLNPKDWGVSKDGVDRKIATKQLTKTVSSWVKEATGVDFNSLRNSDFSDIENKTNKKLWTHALGYGDDTKMSFMDRWGGKAIEDRTNAAFTGKSGTLNIKGVEAYEINSKGEPTKRIDDLYEKTARTVASFVENRDNKKNVEKNYNEFRSEAFKAVNIEIKDNLIKHENDLGGQTMRKHIGAISAYDAAIKTIDDTKSLKKSAGKGISEIKKGLVNSSPGEISNILADVKKEITAKRSDLEKRTLSLDKLLEEGKISKKTHSSLMKSTKQYSSSLDKASEALAGGNTNNILNALKDVSSTNTSKDIYKFCESSVMTTGEGSIGGLLQDRDVAGAGIDLKGKAIAPITFRLRQDKRRIDAKYLIDSFDEEKLLERFVWAKVKEKMPENLRNFTSGKFIENALEKSNHFGLKMAVDDDGNYKYLPRVISKRFERNFGYKVSLDLSDTSFGIRKTILKGGDHFKIFGEEKLLKKLEEGKFLDSIISLKDFRGADATKLRELLSVGFFNKSLKDLSESELSGLNDLFGNVEKWGNWANKWAADNNMGDLTEGQRIALFNAIRNKNRTLNPGYGLERRFIGRLERIHNRILSLQKKWESSFFGKTIKFFSNWKNIISEKAAALLSKALAKIIGLAASATGVLAAVMPFIEKLLQKSIEKLLIYGEAFMKAIISWDFDKLSELIRRDLEKFIKACVVVSAAVIFPLALILIPLFGLIAGSISPIDATKTNGGGNSFGQGENNVVKVTKDIFVTLGDGSVLTNPPSITNEQTSGASFKYKITIIPKITITDNTVSYADVGKYITEGSTRTFFSIPTTTLNVFNAGDGIIIDTQSFNLGPAQYNTLVMNTAIVYTPAVPKYGITDPDTVSYTRYLKIGDFASECPLISGVGTKILTTSLSDNWVTGHGSTTYWTALSESEFYGQCTGPKGPDCYAFPIPYIWTEIGCPGGPVCKRGDQYYGSALDVMATDKSDNGLVVFPRMQTQGLSWTVIKRFEYAVIATSSDGKWKIYLQHVELDSNMKVGSTYNAGDTVGVLSTAATGGGTSHVHIELIDVSGGGDGIPVRPEDLFGSACNTVE